MKLSITPNQILRLERTERKTSLDQVTEEMNSIENKFRAGTYTDNDDDRYLDLELAWSGLYNQIYEA